MLEKIYPLLELMAIIKCLYNFYCKKFKTNIYCMYLLKGSTEIHIDMFVLMCILVVLIFIIIYRWQKANYEIARKEKQLQIANVYNGAFMDLINTIRNRQHEFNNHIDAILGMHLTAKSMEELIELQEAYCNEILSNNRYSKLLNSINNPTVAGFIYKKFIKIEEKGIHIYYNVFYIGKDILISLYDLIEIIGILLDNALDAVIEQEVDKVIIFEMKDDEKQFEISIKNPIVHLSNNDIAKLFVKGYSTKGQGRGIGLSKLKDFQKKYKYDIMVHTYEENNKEWIEFNIIEKK